MEDFFYILAGVAYLAYSIYNANQKQKKKRAQMAEQPYTEPEVSEPEVQEKPTSSFFDEMLGVQNFEFNVEEKLYGETEKEEIIDVVPDEEGIRTTNVESKSEENEKQKEVPVFMEEDSEAETLDYEFDLKNAIISSEILNPPYIDR
jgi:methyltransferase-like protein